MGAVCATWFLRNRTKELLIPQERELKRQQAVMLKEQVSPR